MSIMLGVLEFILFSALCLVNGVGMCEYCLPSPLQQAINCSGAAHMRYAWSNETATCTATQVLDCDSSFAKSFGSLEECMNYASSRARSCNLPLRNLACGIPMLPVKHYYFNPASQECVCFSYFGDDCQGNDNDFLTLEDCISICKSTTTELATTMSMIDSIADSTSETIDDIETTITDIMDTEPSTVQTLITTATDTMDTELEFSTVQTLITDTMQYSNSGLGVYAYICIGIGAITVLLVASSIIVVSIITWKILNLQQNKIMQKEEVAVMTNFSVSVIQQHSQCDNTLPPTAIYYH